MAEKQREFNYQEELPPKTDHSHEHRKAFLISAGAGASFGLVGSIIFLQSGLSP